MILIIIESILICLLISFIMIRGTKRNPLGGLHNLPMKIQERVSLLPEYADNHVKVIRTKERIIKKIPALIILMCIFSIVIYFNGARTFYDGFLYAFVLWTIIKLYVTIVFNCLWYVHSPQYWIKGTEDLKEEYQNYWFYLRSIPRSLLIGCIVSLIVGIVMMLVNGG